MSQLIAVSPVGKNGQTVVPAAIRKMFKIGGTRTMVGFYKNGNHIEIAPVTLEKGDNYSHAELNRLEALAKETGGLKFRTSGAAKRHLKSL